MRTLYRLGSIGTMPIRAHYSWLIAIIIGYGVIQTQVVRVFLPQTSDIGGLLVTSVAVLFGIGVVIAHEIGHILAAKLCGVRSGALNLYPLGAMTRLVSAATDWRALLVVAAAGPLTSILLSWLLNMLASAAVFPLWLAVPLYAAGEISFFVGVVNLLPGLPLDGGRIVRAVLVGSGVSASFDRATHSAERLGQLIACGFVLGGALTMREGADWARALTLILVGWAIFDAGGGLNRRALIAQLFHRLTVGDLARPSRHTIAPGATLREYARTLHGRSGDVRTPVLQDGVLLGLMSRELLRQVPQGYWDDRTVANVMLPAAEIQPLAHDTPLMRALPRLLVAEGEHGIKLPVVADGRLVGMIDAEELSEVLELEDEFGMVGRPRHEAASSAASPGAVRPTRIP